MLDYKRKVFLKELYNLFSKINSESVDDFINKTFKFTYTRTRVIVNTIVGRLLEQLSDLENKDSSTAEQNIKRLFNLSFDRRVVVSARGQIFDIFKWIWNVP